MTADKKCVMIVEDNPRIMRMLAIKLKLEGYDVVLSQDGQEAMGLIEVRPPDILVLDLLLPVMDGFELLRKLRVSSRTPVIACSASGDLGPKALGFGADSFIAKPFNPDMMVGKVRELLAVGN